MLQRTIKRLMRRQAWPALDRAIEKTRPEDLAFILRDLSADERPVLIAHCKDDDKRAAVVADADVALAAGLLAALPREHAVALLKRIEPDDVSDILEQLDDEVAAGLLELMGIADRREVEELSRYDAASAGGIMSPRFFSLGRDTTAGEAIHKLQQLGDDLEMVFYVYVVNEVGQLVGVLSLRQLVTHRPDQRIFDIMVSDVISVSPEVDQEEVAKLASRYGLLAIPVVDDGNKLLGIVTVDDVIDVLREEATEDILRMGGAAGGDLAQQTVLRATLSRFPWLLATGLGGGLSALVIWAYLDALISHVALLIFVPLVLGMTGVTGVQSATIIGRRMDEGRSGRALLFSLVRQTVAGLFLGILCGALLGLGLRVLGLKDGATALLLGTAVAGSMGAAAALGAILPLIFSRLRLDPTLAAGPFVATAVDLVGLVIYLAIGTSSLFG
ncbi:MAG: magnesium transporter [Deltaproteobacteria bacterium]|nr:magnesium transporter [Deltaproteobacteria bacterium]